MISIIYDFLTAQMRCQVDEHAGQYEIISSFSMSLYETLDTRQTTHAGRAPTCGLCESHTSPPPGAWFLEPPALGSSSRCGLMNPSSSLENKPAASSEVAFRI